MQTRQILPPKAASADDDPRVRMFLFEVWRPCNINVDFLLISVSEAKFPTALILPRIAETTVTYVEQ